MGFWDTISKPFKAVGHAVETVYDDAKDVVEEGWHDIKAVAEHIEHDAGVIFEHAEHDVQGATEWVAHEADKGIDAGIGMMNSMEMLPYLAGGMVIFLVLNSNKTAQVIDSGARAIR